MENAVYEIGLIIAGGEMTVLDYENRSYEIGLIQLEGGEL